MIYMFECGNNLIFTISNQFEPLLYFVNVYIESVKTDFFNIKNQITKLKCSQMVMNTLRKSKFRTKITKPKVQYIT